MSFQYRCITNNPIVKQFSMVRTEYHDISILELYQYIRRELEAGYYLVTHPLTGSIRPDLTPYKSILISGYRKPEIDHNGLQLIAQAEYYAKKLPWIQNLPNWDDKAKLDFQFVDKDIIEYALERNR